MVNPYKVVAKVSHRDVEAPDVLAVIQTWNGKWRWRSEVEGVVEGYSKADAFDSLASALSSLARELDLPFEGFVLDGNLPYSGKLEGATEARKTAARLMSEARKADRQVVERETKSAAPRKTKRPPRVHTTARSAGKRSI